MKISIHKFGEESGGINQWYEVGGRRVSCSEDDIDCLWWQWIMAIEVDRKSYGGTTEYTSKSPLFLNVNEA